MTSSSRSIAITKELSANDTGQTGAHQAGILVPKDARILSFFPALGTGEKNPRHYLVFYDDGEHRWEFAFIYYNNAYFDGTRNEFRLTRMTPYIRRNGLQPGDTIVLRRDPETGRRYISYTRARSVLRTPTGRLKLGSSWKEIKI
jgi:hypothetical protein